MVYAAVLGFGTVGGGVVDLIEKNQEQIRRTIPEGLYVKYILDIREFPGSPYADRVVHDIDVILSRVARSESEYYNEEYIENLYQEYKAGK